jgi:hypothetical protein
MVVKDHRAGSRQTIPAMQVLANRVKHGFWLISPKNPYRKRIASGDAGLFYVSSKMGKVIAGKCVITSPPQPITHEIKSIIEGYPSNLLTHYIGIDGVIWASPVEASEVIPNMSFVKNKARWSAYLQGTLHPISPEDFEYVVKYQLEKSQTT